MIVRYEVWIEDRRVAKAYTPQGFLAALDPWQTHLYVCVREVFGVRVVFGIQSMDANVSDDYRRERQR